MSKKGPDKQADIDQCITEYLKYSRISKAGLLNVDNYSFHLYFMREEMVCMIQLSV